MIGTIFDIQRYSVYDGPGIRTTVFLKGCPLNCIWCHNPESQNIRPQLSFKEEKCIYCEACSSICANNVHTEISVIDKHHVLNFALCTGCGLCIKNCPKNALEIIGKKTTEKEVFNEVEKDIKYYQASGGGVTISGGEPFYQMAFLIELLKEAKKRNISACIETCGYTDTKNFTKVLNYTESFLFDFKHYDSFQHQKYCGVGNELIIKNLKYLSSTGKAKIHLRCPIIPGINDCMEHFNVIAELSQLSGVIDTEIMPYHDLGKSKAKSIGKNYKIDTTSVNMEITKLWEKNIQECGCNNLLTN
ncbi:glycyl-radical enzyme activating protein [Clostridium sp.]|uniref:glycyl-radical enzyme activating protein n=1 Tax=Clostridium sp. TaxID=1506 RepID=UPI001A4FE9BD|nr:glycyl-radical enzyme activating protein [Clostridium sp.]MBK5236861.1 glycyl-radical enzyme activating protein [Clostridium sp.]